MNNIRTEITNSEQTDQWHNKRKAADLTGHNEE